MSGLFAHASEWLRVAASGEDKTSSIILAAVAVGVVAVTIAVKRFTTYIRIEPEAVAVKGNPDDTLIVYVPERMAPAVGSTSPFGTKLMAFMRWAAATPQAAGRLKYTVRKANFQKAPKGKMPYIQHGPVLLGDTELIIRYICNTYGLSTPASGKVNGTFVPFECLAPEQQAISTLVTRTCDEHLYWGGVYYAWVKDAGNEENWKLTKTMLKDIPSFIVMMLGASIRRKVNSSLMGHGIGRHGEKDMLYLMERDARALSQLLGTKTYINGDSPSDGDCSMFAVLDGILHQPRQHPLRTIIKQYPNLVAYTDKIRSTLFADQASSSGSTFTPRAAAT